MEGVKDINASNVYSSTAENSPLQQKCAQMVLNSKYQYLTLALVWQKEMIDEQLPLDSTMKTADITGHSRALYCVCGVLYYLPWCIVIGPAIRAPVSPPNEKMETMTVQTRVTW